MKRDLLTEEEMSALLPEADRGAEVRAARRQAVPYNFRRPDRLSKEQVRGLYLLHDLFAHGLSSDFPLFLRAISEVTLISVEQQAYSDYLRGLSDPTTIFTFTAETPRGAFAIELNSSIAFPIVDRMLGGVGSPTSEKRTATEIELKILEGILPIVTKNYLEAWKPITELKMELTGRETRSQMLQIVPPNEVVVTIIYQVQVGEARGAMSICLPVAMLEPVVGKFNQSSYSPTQDVDPETTYALLQTLSDVRLSISAELEPAGVAVADLMDLKIGDVLKLDHHTERPVNVLVGRSPKFAGQIWAMNGKKVIQLTEQKAQSMSAAR